MRKSAVILILCASLPAFGWGPEGHDLVARLAAAHLTPAAAGEGGGNSGPRHDDASDLQLGGPDPAGKGDHGAVALRRYTDRSTAPGHGARLSEGRLRDRQDRGVREGGDCPGGHRGTEEGSAAVPGTLRGRHAPAAALRR